MTNIITQKYPNIQTNELNKVKIFSLENRKQGKDITESNYSTIIIIHKNSYNMISPLKKTFSHQNKSHKLLNSLSSFYRYISFKKAE